MTFSGNNMDVVQFVAALLMYLRNDLQSITITTRGFYDLLFLSTFGIAASFIIPLAGVLRNSVSSILLRTFSTRLSLRALVGIVIIALKNTLFSVLDYFWAWP